MLLKYSVLLSFATLIFRYSDGQAMDDRCYKIPPMENYNLDKINGYWYVQEVGDDDLAHRYCLEYDISNDHKKKGATVVYKAMFKTGNGKINATFTSVQVGNTSQHIALWGGVMRSAWTVGTDYTSWATYYTCIPEQEDKGIVFVATRAKHPTKEIMEKAHNSLRKVGINDSKPYLQPLNRTGCD